MYTGQRNLKGRHVFIGPRGGLYVMHNGKKLYKKRSERLLGEPVRCAALLLAATRRRSKR